MCSDERACSGGGCNVCYVGDCHCHECSKQISENKFLYNIFFFLFLYILFLFCNVCLGGGDSDGAPVLLVIFAIIIVILAFIGIFVGIFLGTMLIQKILQRHMKILWLTQETQKYVVVDFNGQIIPPRPSAPSSHHLHEHEQHNEPYQHDEHKSMSEQARHEPPQYDCEPNEQYSVSSSLLSRNSTNEHIPQTYPKGLF
jgi:hypothetical protein